jgi:hypothetical protein
MWLSPVSFAILLLINSVSSVDQSKSNTTSLPVYLTPSLLRGIFKGVVLRASSLALDRPLFIPQPELSVSSSQAGAGARVLARFDGVSDAVALGVSVEVAVELAGAAGAGQWVGFEVSHRPARDRGWCAAGAELCGSLAERAGSLLRSEVSLGLSLLSNVLRRGVLFSSLFLNSTVTAVSAWGEAGGLILRMDGRLSSSPLPSTALLPTSAFFARPFPLLAPPPASNSLALPSSFARCRFGAATPSASLWTITLTHLGPAGVPGLATAGSLKAALTPGAGQSVGLRVAAAAGHPADVIELSFPDLSVQFAEEDEGGEPFIFSLSCSIQSALLPLTVGPDGSPRLGFPVQPPNLIWVPRSSAVGPIDKEVLRQMTPLLLSFSKALFDHLASDQAVALIRQNALPNIVCNTEI